MDDEARHVECLEQEVRTERRLQLSDADVLPDLAVAGRVPAALVELAVRGQIRLRRDAQHSSPRWMTTAQL